MKSKSINPDKINRSISSANRPTRQLASDTGSFQDQRPEMAVQRMISDSIQLMEEEDLLQGKMKPAQLMEEEDLLQGKMKPANPIQKKGNSTGMPDPVKAKMETAFNTDFSDVNIHANSSSAPEVGALAYTQGADIHFAPGQFKPDSTSGQELLGHELTHVVQQREGIVKPTTQATGMPVNDSPGFEKEADLMGKKAAQTKLKRR